MPHIEKGRFWNDNTTGPRRLCTDICFDSFAIPLLQPPWNALKLVSDFVTTAGAPSPTPPPLLTRSHSFPFPLTASRSPGQLQQTLSRAHARDQDLNRQDLLSSPLKPAGSPVRSSRTQKIAATEARQAVAPASVSHRGWHDNNWLYCEEGCQGFRER